MKSRIFASTACVRSKVGDLESQLAQYVAASLTAIELGFGPKASTADLENYLTGVPAQFLVHNYFPAPPEPFGLNLASQDERILALSLALSKRAISLCARLQSPFYSVHAGCRTDINPESFGKRLVYEQIHPYEKAYATFVRSAHELVCFGEQLGVSLLVEPNVMAAFNLVNSRNEVALVVEAWEAVQLIRDVNHPGLGILLDTGHLNVSAHSMGFNRGEFVDQVAPYVRAFHVHDNDGSADTHMPVGPDSWVLEVLKRKEFATLPVIVEAKFGSVIDLRDHIDWLEHELTQSLHRSQAPL